MFKSMTWEDMDNGDRKSVEPTQEFWEAWRRDKDWVKSQGYRVTKVDGEWVVVHTPIDTKPSRSLESDLEVPVPEGLSYFGYQKAGIEFIYNKDALLADEAGTGKGQVHGSKVYTPKGPVNIEDIRVGDFVIGSNGQPTRVTGVFPLGLRDIYRVSFNDGAYLDVTDDHLWQVHGDRKATTRVLTTAQMYSKEDFLEVQGQGSNSGRNYTLRTHYKSKGGKSIWGIPMVEPVVFEEQRTVIPPYLMGLYLGDGTFTVQGYVHVTCRPTEMEELYGRRDKFTYDEDRGVNYFYDAGYREYLKASGLAGTRSWEKFVPQEYKYNTPEVRLAVLQGLMDTDGYAGADHTEFSTTSEQLCRDIVELTQSLGGVARVSSRYPTYTGACGNKLVGRLNYRVNVKLPLGVNPFRMKRKSGLYHRPTKYIPARRISNIEKLPGRQEATCISVEAKDSLYVAESFIVTHNTIQTAGAINMNPDYSKILIFCPNSVKINWKRELEKWLVQHYTIGIVERDDYPEDTDILIINYDVAVKHKDKLHAVEWDLMVLDESHLIKNKNAQRTKVILGKGKRVKGISAKHKLFLTGTPLLNRPIELYTTLNALDPDNWPNEWNYAHRYCGAVHNGWGWDFSGSSNLEELNQRLRSTIMIRRTKAEALPELPPVFQQVIELPATAALRRLVKKENEGWGKHEEVLSKLQAAVELAKVSDSEQDYRDAVKNLEAGTKASFEELSAIRQELAIAKIPYTLAHLEDVEGKVVIFFHHRAVGEAFKEQLGDDAVMIMGGMGTQERQDAVDAFQNDPKIKYFLGSIVAAGVGITLTASSTVVFHELDYRPAMINQAYSRCILEGQPVLTDQGWVPIEDIRVGDMVVSHDGKLHRVTDTWNRLARGSHARNSKDIAEIQLRGWSLGPIKVTTDHQVLTERGWVEAGDLKPRDKVIMPADYKGTGITEVTISPEEIPNATVVHPEREIFNEYYDEVRISPEFEQQNNRLRKPGGSIEVSKDMMYSLGYYLGDGFCSRVAGTEELSSVSFAGNLTTKATALERCNDWIESLGLPRMNPYRSKVDNGVEARSHSKALAMWVASNFGRVGKDKFVPNWVYETSVEMRREFISGWADADGYTRQTGKHKRTRSTEVTTTSYRLAGGLYRLLLSVGIKPTIHTYENKSGHGNSTCYVVGWAHSELPTTLTVQEVKLRTCNKTERVYDLTVENSNTFTVGGAVVHNCQRIGQQNNVLVQYLLVEGSIDVKMAHSIVAKQEVIDKVLDDEVVIPEEIPSITTPARKELEVRKFSPEEKEELLSKLRLLASYDEDMARAKNNMGFSRVDTRIGHSLASQNTLTDRQATLAERLVNKYRRQLQC